MFTLRRLAAVPTVLLTAVVCTALAPTADAGAGFQPDVPTSRIGGADRFETAALTAVEAFPEGTRTALLANGWRNVDALSGTYLAGLENAPILLTERDSVPASTVAAMHRLGVTDVIVLGDENSVGDTALDQLDTEGFDLVDVVAGEDRYDTAVQVYGFGTTAPDTVYVARGDFPVGQVAADALAAGPAAFQGRPILLTEADALPDVVAEALAEGQPRHVVFLGLGISDDVEDEVADIVPGAWLQTIGGRDRTETAALIAGSGDLLFMGGDRIGIANGYSVDALGAGVLAGLRKQPLLLTAGTGSLGYGTEDYLTRMGLGLHGATVFGSTASVPQALTVRARELARGGPPDVQAVTAVDAAAGTFRTGSFTISSSRDLFFEVDDRRVTFAQFLAVAKVGDAVWTEYDVPRWETSTIHLTTTTPEYWRSGYVDRTPTGFSLVDRQTGTTLRALPVSAVTASAGYSIDGATATRAQFLADLSTGDTVLLGEGTDPVSFALTNESVSGVVRELTPETMLLNTGSASFRLPRPTVDTSILVDGAAAPLARFDDDVTVGDTVFDSTAGGRRSVQLWNVAPPEQWGWYVSGRLLTQAPAAGEPQSAVVTVTDRGDGTSFDIPWGYTTIVGGTPVTPAEFNARITVGAAVKVQRPDASSHTTGSISSY